MSLLNSWSTLTPPPLPPRGRFSSSSQSPPQKMALTAAVLVLDCLFFLQEIITKEGSLYTLDACCFNCFVWYFADIGVYTTTDTNGNWGRYHPAAEGVWHKLEVEQGLYGGNQVILTFQMSSVKSNPLFSTIWSSNSMMLWSRKSTKVMPETGTQDSLHHLALGILLQMQRLGTSSWCLEAYVINIYCSKINIFR